ncbi:MAG: diguanylate cyclase, partial [Waterburya sp.]
RPADIAFRYGGEEFAVILPHTDGQGAIKVAEEIQQQILDLKLSHVASEISDYITLSIGVSSIIPDTRTSPHKLISAADSALYDAKFKGRNRVVFRSVELV